MALTSDQKAMLRLLAQREEGYEDIAALKGVNVEAVRAEVKAAVAALDNEVSAAGPVVGEGASGLTRPDTPSPPPPAEERAAPAPRPRAKVKAPRSAPRWKERLPRDRQRVIELGGGALVVLLLILFVTGAIDIGGGGDDDSSSDGQANAGGQQLTAAEEEKLTQARLQPVGESDASGRAIFGRVGQEEVALQATGQGLEPNGDGDSYSIWLYRSPKLALQVGSVKVRENGALAARFPLPPELLAYVASGAFPQIYVSRTDNATLQRRLNQARKENELPRYTGETVLRGEVTGPIVDAGQKAGNEAGGGNGNGG
jgi:hypothetical protein